MARSLEGLQGTLQAIQAAGGTAEGFAANVADSAKVKRIVDEVEEIYQLKSGANHVSRASASG